MISAKFVKHLEDTELYEMRVSVGNNEYRTILFAVDSRSLISAVRIILLNGGGSSYNAADAEANQEMAEILRRKKKRKRGMGL